MEHNMEYYSGIKDSQNTWMSREEAFRKLEKMGARQAIVHFSGGHDEGGTDHIYLYSEKVDTMEEHESWQSYSARRDAAKIADIREHIWPDYKKDENGETVYEEGTRSNGSTWRRPVRGELTDEQKEEMRLGQTLAAPVYDRYYSFAGEFSVEGTVIWDVEARTAVMDGQESIETYEGFSEEV